MTFKIWKLKIWFRLDLAVQNTAPNFVCFGEWNDKVLTVAIGTRYDFFFELYRFKSGFSILK